MIQFQSGQPDMIGEPGKEPTIVRHDCHTRELCTNANLLALFDTVPDENIKAKTVYQDWSDSFCTHGISRPELLELIENTDRDCWIVLHEIESNLLLKNTFSEIVLALKSSFPIKYGDVRFCTGSLFISRGDATTPFHFDNGSNILLQLRGHKRFLAFSPNDSDLVSKQSLREFFSGQSNPPSLKYDKSFDEKALAIDLEPGLGIYMPSTSPHCTHTQTRDLSVTISLSFVCPHAEHLRRTSLFDAKLPALQTIIPDAIKCWVLVFYENMIKKGHRYRHKSFRRLPL